MNQGETMIGAGEMTFFAARVTEQGPVDLRRISGPMPDFAAGNPGDTPLDPSVAEFIAEGGNDHYINEINEGMQSDEADQTIRKGWLTNVAAGVRAGAQAVGAKVGNAIDSVTPSTKIGATSAVTLALAGLGAGATAASAETATATPTITTTVEIGIAGSRQTVESASAVRIVGNARSISRARFEKDKRAGKCDKLTSKQVIAKGIKTQGYRGSGRKFEYENRPSTMCDSDGDGDYDYRGECGNAAKGGRANPLKAMANLWVNNYNNAKASVRAKAVATALAFCKTANTYAAAYGHGEGEASGSIKVSTFQKAKGKLQSLVTRKKVQAEGKASAKASASASVVCIELGGTIVPPSEVPEEFKDGTQTPPPPANAPGPNPAPSPQDPTVTPGNPTGSWQCFDEVTGAPAGMGPCDPGEVGGPA